MKTWSTLTFVLILSSFPHFALPQEEGSEDFAASENRKRQQMLQSDVENIRAAQTARSPLSGGPLLTSDPYWLLDLAPIMKELKITLDQSIRMDQLESEVDTARGQHVESFKKLKEMEPGPAYIKEKNKLHDQVDALTVKRATQFQSILSQDQQARLNQLVVQFNRHCRGEFDHLDDPDNRRLLKINDDQRQRLKRRAQELDAEFQQKYQQLVAETKRKMLQELSDEQRKILQDMQGTDFDMAAFNLRKENE